MTTSLNVPDLEGANETLCNENVHEMYPLKASESENERGANPDDIVSQKNWSLHPKRIWLKIFHNEAYRIRVFYSFVQLWSFFVLGWTLGQIGPVMLDLALITNVKIDTASLIVVAIGTGYMTGSIIGGYIYEKISRPLLLAVTSFIHSITITFVPWCVQFELMAFVIFVYGTMEGAIDTVINTEMVAIWNKSNDSWMQAKNLLYAIGAVISPLVMAPFLVPESEVESHKMSNISTNDISNSSQVYKAYFISGFVSFIAFILYSIIFLKYKTFTFSKQEEQQETSIFTPPRHIKVLALCVIGTISFLYEANEESFAEFLTIFCVQHLHMTKSQGADITSLFYATLGIFLFLSIIFVNKIHPFSLVFIDCLLLNGALLGITISGLTNFTMGIWIFTPIVGIGLSAIQPILYTWTDEHITSLSGKISALYTLSGSIGGMVNAPFLGWLMEDHGPMWFCYILFSEALIMFILCICALFLQSYTTNMKKKHHHINDFS